MLDTAHASMSGDLSGTMKDLNISRLFVKKSCLFHRKIPLWIEHKHFTISFFMK